MTPVSPARRRRGAGAVLAVSVLGVLVLSGLVLTQGYLSDSISRADAVLAGRQAEYLADAAVSEALWKLQEGRNALFQDLFLNGGSVGISPDETRGVVSPRVSLDDVVVEVGTKTDFHGDGRGHYGTVDVKGVARVSRRVARITGTSSYRRVLRRFEFKSVQQGPHPDFQPYTLYVRQLVSLPKVEQWYVNDLQGEWDRVRTEYIAGVKEDADEVVRVTEDLQGFVGRCLDALVYAKEWPDLLTDWIGGRSEWNLNPDPDIDFGGIGVGKVDKVRIRLDAKGDARAKILLVTDWKDNRDEIPPVRELIREALYKELRDALLEFFPGMSAGADVASMIDQAIDELSRITGFAASEFYTVSESDPTPVPENDWRAFREDGASLTNPATFEVAMLRHDELMLHPPTRPQLPDSPLRRMTFPLPFEPDGWRTNLNNASASANWAELVPPFLDADDLYTAAFEPYAQEWADELQRYEELILLSNAPGETGISHGYWDSMASYQFPDSGTMASYIGSRWGGNAGAVYRIPGGDVDLSAFQGDATFAAAGPITVQGSPPGAMNIVTADTISVGGDTRATLMSQERPVNFDGATVTGTVAARGLKNLGDGALDPFTINHDPMDAAPWTVNVSEYPVAILVDRGD